MSEETLFNLEDNALFFYALGYGCQLHRHLPVALAVGFHGPVAKCLGMAMYSEAYGYRPN